MNFKKYFGLFKKIGLEQELELALGFGPGCQVT